MVSLMPPSVRVKFAEREFTFKAHELRPVKASTPPSWKLEALVLVAFMIGLAIVVATAVAAQGSEFNWRAPGAGSPAALGTAAYVIWAMLGALNYAGMVMAVMALCAATLDRKWMVSTGTRTRTGKGIVHSYGTFN